MKKRREAPDDPCRLNFIVHTQHLPERTNRTIKID